MASSKQGDSNAGRRAVSATNPSGDQPGHQKGNQSGNQSGNSAAGSKQSGDTSSRGFASMDPARQREIAAQGGRAAHQKGTAHEFTPEEARRAGSMSHKNSQRARTASSSGTGQHAGSAASQGAASSQQGEQDN
ncbi:MAG: hypothetical protein K2X55_06815 [Burkholderiaceae bacterium]|nr:hypothetical protein [Burkholderiaceae bacterium]